MTTIADHTFLNVLVMPACQLRPLCAHVGSPRGRRRRRRRCCQKALIYHNIHHSGKQMSDSSPIFRRKPRHKAPIIKDSPKSPPSKKPVPPSPVVPEIGSAEPSPLSPASQAKKLARRQKQLTTQFFGWGTGFRVL